MNLIFLRHGQSIWNLENRFTGWVDVGLSDGGVDEALNAGNTLLNKEYVPDICFTSYLKRSKETANILLSQYADEVKQDIEIVNDWTLNERHYGSLQGLDKSETANKYGEEQVQLWRRSYDTPPPLAAKNSDFDPNNDKLYKNINQDLPLGESLKDVLSRVKKTISMILNLSETKNVLVVAHGNSIRAILKIIEDISDKDIIGINIPTGIPLAFNYQDDKLTKIGYLGDQEQIIKLQKEVEQQSRIKKG